ncbi:putative liporotein [Thermoclostridium stercorarium subsp. stercorarium DSM 8532]|uniref:DUF3502 domain-containing protein n=2 Tax=Thermoclostridium stercorarium TaxID=1510 RepID=A0A1B1YAV5_THEST|nr:ABC transporter substrate-binding protein [Thermoclostridium stercorarium]AGC67478.1 putative liporotein [Thermoclostridium stercorarium subsp. stercorarium DSM 8532]AGI38534.1 ABC transporter periplasmic subunit [Thermoclostridium stercorarium subsp. stercorarium DSM 8532]ANW97907.1 hypothetical protein CSTERTH_02075 [Thermoclostridium stercorarium subsp. thermolacticum DSM 2910]UZQ86064.1 ABC transporter substrate-binding protein [Thermoclostridium stercorarium]
MRKKFKTVSSVILALLMVATLFAGCGQKNASTSGGQTQPKTETGNASETKKEYNGIDISKPVNLVMLFVGDKVADQDLVYEEVNKLAKEDLNCTVTVKNLSWADYQQQYPLVLASGEQLDLVYAAEWLGYFDHARKGAFHEITMDDIKKYMPITYEEQDPVTFEQAMVDGKLYMIPNYQFEYNVYRLIGVRMDLAKKYGITEIKTFEDLERFCEAIAENEKEMFAIAHEGSGGNDNFAVFYRQPNQIHLVGGGTTLFGIKYVNGEFDYDNLFNVYFTPEFAEYAKMMRRWAEKGFWSKNAASGQGKINDLFVAGKSAVDIWHIGGVAQDIEKAQLEHPDWEMEIIDLTPESFKTVSKFTNNGVAVSINTVDFGRSLMLLEKFKNDQRYFDLTCVGIEGKHWIDIGPNKFRPGPDANNFPIYGTSMWGWISEKFRRVSETEPKQLREYINSWIPDVVYPITDNFIFDDTNVKSEYAAVSNVVKTYATIFDLGMAEDIEKTIEEMKDKLNKAGYEKVEAEFRRQYEDFIKANLNK